MQYLKALKIGFIGTGNMSQAIIKGLVDEKLVTAEKIIGSNRTPGKLQKLHEQHGIRMATNNEQVINESDIVIIGVKPQDFYAAVEPLASAFNENQIVISLAAGIRLDSLEKLVSQVRWARLIPNTPSLIRRGVLGYLVNEGDEALETTIEDLFQNLGHLVKAEDEEQLEALTVACASGTGFVFEMMLYWQEWLEEHEFSPEQARKITIETFLGASLLASQNNDVPVEELQARVTSKKGVTFAGLSSMRELEIERALRLSFEKAAMRNNELAKELK